MNVYETRRIRSERRRAFFCLGELFLITAIQFVAGLGLLVMGHLGLAVFLVLLSVLSLYFGSMASAYFESIRPSGDRETDVHEVLWAAPKLRLASLLANAGCIVGATVLLWSAYSRASGFAVVPAVLLLVTGSRAIYLVRDYRRARVRELESRE